MISIEELTDIIEYASMRLTVLVPSTCYYSRQGDYSEDTIDYIDSQAFLNALHSIKQQKELNAST